METPPPSAPPPSAPPATPPPSTPPPSSAPPATPPPATSPINSYVGEKGELKAGWHKALGLGDGFAKFTSLESAFNSHASLERMLSGNKVVLPGPTSTPEERAAFFEKLGRPAKPEDYALAPPAKIGDKEFPKELWRDDRAKGFAAKGHELGLTKDQMAGIAAWEAEQALNDHEASQTAQQQAKDGAIAKLKAEWGANYDAQLALANKAAQQLGVEGLLNHPLANDPVFIKAMAAVGKQTVEENTPGSRQGHQPVNARAEINRIRADKTHPYHIKGHPQHADAVKQVNGLYQQAFPEKSA